MRKIIGVRERVSHSCCGQEVDRNLSRYSSPDTHLHSVHLLPMLLLHLLQLSIQAPGRLSEPHALLLIIPNLRECRQTGSGMAPLGLILQATLIRGHNMD